MNKVDENSLRSCFRPSSNVEKKKETIEYVEKKFKYPAVIVQEVNWVAFH